MPPIKSLPGLAMRNRYTAHLACIGGCLDYLGLPASDAWLWGGTGHAFVLNIHKTLCPSGPTAWVSRQLFELANGLGYDIKGVFAQEWVNAEAYAAKQREAWDFARVALDRGLPCYGWEVRPYIPDYFVIPGYDEVGYYYGGYWGDAGGGPTPWETLGTHDVHMIEVYSVEPHPPVAPAQVVRAALTAAVDLAERRNGRILPEYATGPAGFALWAESLESGLAAYEGSVYNAQVWGECRALAVGFLREAREKLAPTVGSPLDIGLAQAELAYSEVSLAIASLLALHPERPRAEQDWKLTLTSAEGARLMRSAADAEARALAGLKAVLAALG
jgi:hypothetical protein